MSWRIMPPHMAPKRTKQWPLDLKTPGEKLAYYRLRVANLTHRQAAKVVGGWGGGLSRLEQGHIGEPRLRLVQAIKKWCAQGGYSLTIEDWCPYESIELGNGPEA
jgi:hypothetical protein